MENKLIQAIEAGQAEVVQQLVEQSILNEQPETLDNFAQILVSNGYFNEAITIYEHFHFLFPEEGQFLVDQAQLYIEIGNDEKAMQLLSSISEDDPVYIQALLTMADYYQVIGYLEVAEQKIERALKILPNEPMLMFAKAQLLDESGRFLEASCIFESLLKEDNEQLQDWGIRIRLAQTYSAGGAYEEAIPLYEAQLDNEIHPDTLFQLSYASFQSAYYEKAIRHLEELLAMDPDYFNAYLLLSESYQMIEDDNKAYEIITAGIARDEMEKEYYLVAGKLAMKLGKTEEAENYLRQSLAIDPGFIEATISLASLLSTNSDFEGVVALSDWLKSYEEEPMAIYPIVAQAYVELEQFDDAYSIYKLAYTEWKEDETFLEEYLYFLLEEGKRVEAIEIVLELQKLQPLEEKWEELIDRLNEQ